MFHFDILAEMTPCILALEGDMDIDAYEIVKEDIIPALGSLTAVVISFARIRFVDSTGIGLLIELVQTLQKNGTSVTITDVSADIQEIFQLLQLPDILGKEIFA